MGKRTPEQYKRLTISEFTKAAEIYETDHAGIYKICKDDYPYIEAELSCIEYRDLLDCGCGTGAMISLLHDGDVRAYSFDEIRCFCRNSGLRIENQADGVVRCWSRVLLECIEEIIKVLLDSET